MMAAGGLQKKAYAPPSDTPGPGAYDVQTSLLNGDRHKHFGFIQKSERFRERKTDENGVEYDDEGSEESSAARNSNLSRNTKLEKAYTDEIHKLKKEVEKWQIDYHRQIALGDKNKQILEERLSRISAELHNLMREKTELQTLKTTREREVTDLLHRNNLLKQNLEKMERATLAQQDRAGKITTQQKRLEDLQKQNDKLRQVAQNEKQFTRAKEAMEKKIAELKQSLSDALREKGVKDADYRSLQTQLHDVEAQKSKLVYSIQRERDEALEMTHQLKNELSIKIEELQSLRDELQILDETNQQNLKVLSECQHTVDRLEDEREELGTSHRAQQEAYLGRISTLETELETLQRQKQMAESSMQDLCASHHGNREKAEQALRAAELTIKDREAQIVQLRQEHDNDRDKLESILEELKRAHSGLGEHCQQLMKEHRARLSEQEGLLHKSNAAYEARTAELAHEEEKLKISTEKFEKLRHEKDAVESALDKEKAVVHKLTMELAEIKGKLDWQKKLYEEATEKISQMRADAEERENDFQAKQTLLDDKELQLSETRKDAQKIKVDLQAAKSELERWRQEANQTSETASAREVDLKKKEDKLLNLQYQLRTTEDNLAEKIQCISRLEKEQFTLKEDLIEVKQRLAETQAAESLQKQTIERLNGEVSNLKNELTKSRADMLQGITTRDSEIEKLLASNDTLTVKLADSQRTIQSLQADVDQRNLEMREKDLASARAIQEASDRLNIQEKSAAAKLAELEKIVSDLEAAKQRTEAKGEEKDMLLRTLETEATTAKQLVESLQHSLHRKECEWTEADQAREKEQVELRKEFEAERDSLEQDIRSLRENESSLHEDLFKLQQLMEEVRQTSTAEQQQLRNSHRQEIDNLNSDIADLTRSKELLAQDLNIVRDAHSRLQAKLDETQDAAENMKSADAQKIAELQASYEDKLSSQQKAMDLQISQLQETHKQALDNLVASKDQESSSLRDSFHTKFLEQDASHKLESDRLRAEAQHNVEALIKLTNFTEERQKQYETSLAEARDELDNVRSVLQKQISQSRADLEEKDEQLQRSLINAEESARNFKEQLASQQHTHSEEIALLRKDIADQTSALEQLTNEYHRVEQDLTIQVESSREEQKRTESLLEGERSDRLQDRTTFETRIAELAGSHAQELKRATEQREGLEAKLQQEVETHATVVSGLRTQLEEANTTRSKLTLELEDVNQKLDQVIELRSADAVRNSELVKQLEVKEKHLVQARREKETAEVMLIDTRVHLEAERQRRDHALSTLKKENVTLRGSLTNARNALSVIELQKANELSSKDAQIRKLQEETTAKDADLKDLKSEARQAIAAAKREAEKARLEADNIIEQMNQLKSADEQLKELENVHKDSRQELEGRLTAAEDEISKLLSLNDRLRIANEDAERKRLEMEESHRSQLELLKQRGQLKDSEVRKLGELNADLFGHANTKQKIKHVAQLKEENVKLKTDNLSLHRRCEDMKRKILNMDRELESFRSLGSLGRSTGPNNPRKVSRVGRSVLARRQENDESVTTLAIEKIVVEEADVEDKENLEFSYSTGGLSFVA